MAAAADERPPWLMTDPQIDDIRLHKPQQKNDFAVAALNRNDNARLKLARLTVDFGNGTRPTTLLQIGELRSNPDVVIWMHVAESRRDNERKRGLLFRPTFWSRQELPEEVWWENLRTNGASLAVLREKLRRQPAGPSEVAKDWETAKVYEWSQWSSDKVWLTGDNTIELNVNPWWCGNRSIKPLVDGFGPEASMLHKDYLVWLWTQHASTEQVQDLRDRGYRAATQEERYVRSGPTKHIETIRYKALGLRNDYYSLHPTPVTDSDIWNDFDSRPADYDLDRPAVLERIQVAFARHLRCPAPEKDFLLTVQEESWQARYTVSVMRTPTFYSAFRYWRGRVRPWHRPPPALLRQWHADRHQDAVLALIQGRPSPS